MQQLIRCYRLLVVRLKCIDWLWLWAFQLYLAPIFLAVAVTKFSNFDDMVAWFGNADSGLGLPMPVWPPVLSCWVALHVTWFDDPLVCYCANFYHAGCHGYIALGQRLVCNSPGRSRHVT